ncbi:conserved hypothetical protein [Deferribacter desulfuricans SSM1]|uniref:DUF1858 domain-containing protein n=1 Tax=Deferribacter desulfuricans (strain DSM 14783 / JCM 11476 / NBRC 101012 / SSM1) TaxID=639282 RepID=D3PDU1_DEFDS|nr:DUF1858 domain-containing protein [Deferribacter desulfuricans]BAI80764.1 conserved hypothetical protein [Deferribacter desulfuricans SSM1]
MITKETTIEELVNKKPKSVEYMSKKGIICVKCGEPIWGTIYEVCKDKGFNDQEIEEIVKELNNL